MELGPQNITVLDGKDATMNCRAAGAPTPNITWIYNGELQYLCVCSAFTNHSAVCCFLQF